MSRLVLGAVAVALFLMAGGCSLVHQHRAILPPPGCSRCHQKLIEGNWHVLFKPATLHDETDTGRAGISANGRPPRDGEWRRCFSCHHVPAKDHAFTGASSTIEGVGCPKTCYAGLRERL